MEEINVLQYNKVDDDYKYVRANSNEINSLSKTFTKYYNADNSLIVTSRLHAINVLINFLVKIYSYKECKKYNFIISNELYSETYKIISLTEIDKTINYFDIQNQLNDIEEINKYALDKEKYPDGINIIFADSFSNLSGFMINYDSLKNFKKVNPNTIIIIDNTNLSHLLHNPFDKLEIDYVITSLTEELIKLGVIILNKNYDDLLKFYKKDGIHISPIYCKFVYNNLLKNDVSIFNSTNVFSTNNEIVELSKKFNEFYKSTNTLIVSSGLHAINVLLKYLSSHSVMSNYDKYNFIIPTELYLETYKSIELLDNIDKSISYFDIHKQLSDIQEINNFALDNNIYPNGINIIIAESCSNPNGFIINYDALKYFKEVNPNTIIIIDNTWLTHLMQNPFDYKINDNYVVDYVFTSLTKYYTGGLMIGGAIMVQNNFDDLLSFYKKDNIYMSSIVYKFIFNNVLKIDKRIRDSSDNTIYLIKQLILEFTDKCLIINHPYMNNIQFKNDLYPSVLTITINNNGKIEEKIFKNLVKENNIYYKTSFGSSDTKIDKYPKINYINNEFTFRISIGYDTNIKYDTNNIKNLIKKLIL